MSSLRTEIRQSPRSRTLVSSPCSADSSASRPQITVRVGAPSAQGRGSRPAADTILIGDDHDFSLAALRASLETDGFELADFRIDDDPIDAVAFRPAPRGSRHIPGVRNRKAGLYASASATRPSGTDLVAAR